MNYIKNYDSLATNSEKKSVLDLINTGLESVQPEHIISQSIKVEDNILKIKDQEYNLRDFNNVFLIGIGKGSAGISKLIEDTLGDHLIGGYVIDTTPAEFKTIVFTQGTHPLPSQENLTFTKSLFENMRHLSEHDLVLVVICGGGSAMLVSPNSRVSLDDKINVNKALLHSGADIIEMNTVRKHLSSVKGGGLAKLLYPAKVASLIFSDVPGNDLSFIASGPTVKDETTIDDALNLIDKYDLREKIGIPLTAFTETPKDEKFFTNVSNVLMLSNLTALHAMEEKAKELGYSVRIFSDKIKGDADEVATLLLNEAKNGEILLSGGETTVKVTGSGKGGRNLQLVLSSLSSLDENTFICSYASDGWDNTEYAGAIGSLEVVRKAEDRSLSIEEYMNNNDSFTFFQAVEEGIDTGRLPSNVSDLMVVLKK